MKNALLLLSLLIGIFSNGLLAKEPGRVVSCQLWRTVSKDDLSKRLEKRKVPKALLDPKFDVNIYDVIYVSHWHDGTEILASGLFFVPQGVKEEMPQLVYHHGTRMKKGREVELSGESNICVAYASDGYLVLMPDYIGLGHGEKFHLYQQYQSLGQASVDFLFAARLLSDSLGLRVNDQLFLSGYSEGGYAAIAANKFIQEKYSDEFSVTAASGNAGAYDMAGVQSEAMFRPYPHPHYLPFLLVGLNEVYGIWPEINDVYVSPYDTVIQTYLDWQHGYRELDSLLPPVPAHMVHDTFIELFLNDPDFPMRKALIENSLCNWMPENPVQLCHCKGDEEVDYRNSVVALKGMKDHGAKHLMLRNAGSKFGHQDCAVFASLYSKFYFDSFRNGSRHGRKGGPWKLFLLRLARAKAKP